MVNDVSTLIRYSLPGWLFILVLMLPHLTTTALGAPCRSSLSSLTVAQPGSVLASLGAAIIVASVPIGFFIYQVYFLSHWVWNRKARREIPRKTANDTALAARLPEGFSAQWFVVESYWFILLAQASKERGGALLASRAGRLFDIYHSLGAVSTAAIVASVCILSNLITASGRCLLFQVQAWLPTTVVLVVFWVAIWWNRIYVRENIETFQNTAIRFLEKGIDTPTQVVAEVFGSPKASDGGE